MKALAQLDATAQPEVPEGLALAVIGALTLFSAAFLLAALLRLARRLPARARPADRWPGLEAAAVFLAPFACGTLFGLLTRAESLDEVPTVTLLLWTQILLGCGACLAVLLARRRPHGLAGLGLGTDVPRAAFGAVALAYLPLFFFIGGVNVFWSQAVRHLGWETDQEVVTRILELQGAELLLAAVIAIGVGPFLEELLFRGFLQGFMAQVVGERWALVCASALFARLHGVAAFPLLFVLSLFLGWLQQRTRSVWVPFGAHALHNAVQLTVAFAVVHVQAHGVPA